MALLPGSAAIHAGTAVSGVVTNERSLALECSRHRRVSQVQQGVPVYVVTTAADRSYGVGPPRTADLLRRHLRECRHDRLRHRDRADTISVVSSLPSITAPVTIDGTSQPGYSGVPLIVVDGNGLNTATSPGRSRRDCGNLEAARTPAGGLAGDKDAAVPPICGLILKAARISHHFQAVSFCRSCRDCGNLEAVRCTCFATMPPNDAAVAATAAILRRIKNLQGRPKGTGRSRRDCGNLEAE